LEKGVLKKGDFGEVTIPQLLRIRPWLIILPLCVVIIGLLAWLESAGL
jgi:hypothetical protein